MTEVGPVAACRVPENRTFADVAERAGTRHAARRSATAMASKGA